MNENDIELVEGSGNVFRDFDDPLADLKQAKALLAARIIAVLDDRELSVRKAASRTGFAAADFSRVRNADLWRFTLDRLMRMLAMLDRRIRVTVHVEGSRSAGAVSPRRPACPRENRGRVAVCRPTPRPGWGPTSSVKETPHTDRHVRRLRRAI